MGVTILCSVSSLQRTWLAIGRRVDGFWWEGVSKVGCGGRPGSKFLSFLLNVNIYVRAFDPNETMTSVSSGNVPGVS